MFLKNLLNRLIFGWQNLWLRRFLEYSASWRVCYLTLTFWVSSWIHQGHAYRWPEVWPALPSLSKSMNPRMSAIQGHLQSGATTLLSSPPHTTLARRASASLQLHTSLPLGWPTESGTHLLLVPQSLHQSTPAPGCHAPGSCRHVKTCMVNVKPKEIAAAPRVLSQARQEPWNADF